MAGPKVIDVHPYPASPKTGPAMALLQPVNGVPLPTGYPVVEVSNDTERVRLEHATALYQAVYGSDGGSRYFMVGDFGDLKVAVRWIGGKMSIRVEGTGVGKHAKALSEIGLTGKDPTYKSIHLQSGTSDVVAQKTVGAILLSIGQNLLSPLPSVKAIKGKGT